MLYSRLFEQWRLRAGLSQQRDQCSLDYAAAVNIDNVLHRRIADWYVRLVRERHFDVLIPADISSEISVEILADRRTVHINLPDNTLELTALYIENKPCRIIDAERYPRLAELVLAPMPGISGPIDGLEAVYRRADRTVSVPFCRAVPSDQIRCSALRMPEFPPSDTCDFPVRESALALIDDIIQL